MREIGSEFWDVPVNNKKNRLFPENTQWFLSGRSALQTIIKELAPNLTIALPSWCCDSIIKPFVDAGMIVRFYPVYFSRSLIKKIDLDNDVLFLIDYFGYTSDQLDLSDYKGIVIRDLTHSLFSAKYTDADYYFGSLRKWCGVWTGGFAWKQDGQRLYEGSVYNSRYACLRDKAMRKKADYLCGKQDNKNYLSLFERAEKMLANTGIAPAAERDILLASNLNSDVIGSRRRVNAEVLINAFSDWLIFSELKEIDCPMFVPVLVPDGKRDALRRYLIQHEIYCPVHWPVSEYHHLTKKDLFIYENELSLICDQRYDEEDMYRIIETISAFWKEA